MPEETPESTDESNLFGVTKSDVGEIVVRAIVTTIALTAVKVIARKAETALETRRANKAVSES